MVTNPTSATTYAIGPQQGWYYANITDTNGCNVVDSVFLTYQNPIGLLTGDTLLCQGDSITLVAETGPPGTAYNWSPAGDFASASPTAIAQNTLLSSRSTETFVLNTTTNTGCSFFDTVAVSVDTTCCFIAGAGYAFRQDTLPAPAGISGQVITIRDTLWIDGSVTISNSTLEMQPYAVIWVLPGASLTIDNSTVRAGCGVMWDGIYTEGITANVVITNSTVQDALNGVVSLQGGGFRLSGNTFFNDRRHLQVLAFAGTHTGVVTGNVFSSDSLSMLPPWAGEMTERAIYVDRVNDWVFGATGNLNRNTIQNAVTGIFAKKANLKVINNGFRQHAPLNRHEVPGVQLHEGVAIYAEGEVRRGAPGNYRLTVGGAQNEANQFSTCVDGVQARHNMDLRVFRNSFQTLLRNGIWAVENYGREIQVRENVFRVMPVGVSVSVCTASEVTIEDNDLKDPGYGILRGIGLWDLLYERDTVAGFYLIENNDLQVYGEGIMANATPNLDIISNDITVNVQPNQPHGFAGVMVAGSYAPKISGNDVRGLGSPADTLLQAIGIHLAQTAKATVCQNDLWNFWADLLVDGPRVADANIWKNWFRGGHYGLFLRNDAGINQQGGQNAPTANRWQGVFGSGFWAFTLNTPGGNIDWAVRNILWENPALAGTNGQTGGSAINFQSTSGTPNFSCNTGPLPGRGGNGPRGGSIGNSGNSPIKRLALTYLQGTGSPKEQMAGQYVWAELNADASLATGDSLLTAFSQQARGSNLEKIHLGHEAVCGSGNTAHCGQFSPGTPLESWHKETLIQLDSTFQSGIELLSPTIIQEITLRSEACPAEMGASVWQNRSLRSAWQPQKFYRVGCGIAAKTRLNQPPGDAPISSAKWDIWPDPAAREFQVAVTSSRGEIRIFSVEGKEMARWQTDGKTTHYSVACETWPQGLYLVKWLTESGDILLKRVVIQR